MSKRQSISSDSSEDVVLFVGRTKVSLPSSRSKSRSAVRRPSSPKPAEQPNALGLLTSLSHPAAARSRRKDKAKQPQARGRKGRASKADNVAHPHGYEHWITNQPDEWVTDPGESSGRGFYDGLHAADKSEEDAALADYIANLAAQSSDSSDELHDMVKETENIRISEATATSAGRASIHTNVQTTTIHRLSDGEPSDVIDEAFHFSDASSDNSLGTVEQAVQDLQDALDHVDHDSSLYERTADRMTDEQLARRMAKQEELGLGSSDLVLLNGNDDSGPFGVPDLDALERDAREYTRLARNKGKGRSKLAASSAFLDAMDADPYTGFDVMDRERVSVRRSGRSGMLDLALSDSDLERSLLDVWAADKVAKKQRRAERELLRAEGLLGRGADGKANLKAKYKEGLVWDDVKVEMSTFLASGRPT